MNELHRRRGGVTATITGATAPTSGKMSVGNKFNKKVESLLPFLAGASLVGVVMLAYFMPLMINLAMDRVEARVEAKTAKMKTDIEVTKQDAKIAKEDALEAIAKLEEMKK